MTGNTRWLAENNDHGGTVVYEGRAYSGSCDFATQAEALAFAITCDEGRIDGARRALKFNRAALRKLQRVSEHAD